MGYADLNEGNVVDDDEEYQDMDDVVADENESRPSMNSNSHFRPT